MKISTSSRSSLGVECWCLIAAVLCCASTGAASVRYGDFGQYDSPGNLHARSFDIYAPNGGIRQGVPTIIDIHGGGYSSGDKAMDWQFCAALADRGYNVVSMNYTLAVPNVSSSFPQTFRDVRAMIRWIRTTGAQHGLSPTIVITGQSAGVTIGIAAAYAPETPEFLPPGPTPPGGYRVDAAVGFFGRYDLVWDAQTYGTPNNIYNYLLRAYTQPGGPELYAAASARTYVSGCSPPTKLVVGDQDDVVPMGNSTRLAAALTGAGVFNILQVVPGAGHGTGLLGSPIFLADAAASAIPNLLAANNPDCGSIPPPNDQCLNAQAIVPGDHFESTTVGAGNDGPSAQCGFGDTRDVWFRFVPPETRWHTFSMQGTTGMARTSMTIFDGCGVAATLLDCGHAPVPGDTQVRFLASAGAPILVRIAGDNGASGPFQLHLDLGEPYYPPPGNDDCSGAFDAALGFSLGTTLGARSGASGPCGVEDVADAWFWFVAPTTARFRFDTLGSFGLSDTTLAIYPACNSAPIACNDNFDDDTLTSRIDLLMAGGASVRVRVAGSQSTSGSFVLGISQLVAATGACCAAGECTNSDADHCDNGVFTAGTTCASVPCNPIGQVPGACCAGTACTITDPLGCSGSFTGSGTACGQAGNPVACCPANFNAVGGVSVQDVFDFLSAYFMGDPRGDFNGSGSTSVQDVFDFLSAYFRGCS